MFSFSVRREVVVLFSLCRIPRHPNKQLCKQFYALESGSGGPCMERRI